MIRRSLLPVILGLVACLALPPAVDAAQPKPRPQAPKPGKPGKSGSGAAQMYKWVDEQGDALRPDHSSRVPGPGAQAQPQRHGDATIDAASTGGAAPSRKLGAGATKNLAERPQDRALVNTTAAPANRRRPRPQPRAAHPGAGLGRD
jgi:hypothetical protein